MTNQYKQFDMELAVLGLFFIIALDEIYGQQALQELPISGCCLFVDYKKESTRDAMSTVMNLDEKL